MKSPAPRAHRVSHERWLVSYADFITLLFALFVVLFASTRSDRARVSESVRTALQTGGLPAALRQVMGGAPQGLDAAAAHLRRELATEIAAGKVQIGQDARGLVITLMESAFFPSGEDRIYPAAHDAIGKVAQVVRTLPNPVRLEGHTDSIPIHNALFQSNWQLSAARAIAVLNLLRDRFGLWGKRFSIAGYADTVPLDTNETPEGRARNRRVEIVILSASAPE